MTQSGERGLRALQTDGVRWLIAAAGLVIVVAGLREAQGIILPVLFGALFAVLGNAPLSWLRRRGVPTVVAVILVSLVTVMVIFGLFSFFSSSVDQLRHAMPRYQVRFVELREELSSFLDARGLATIRQELLGGPAVNGRVELLTTPDLEVFGVPLSADSDSSPALSLFDTLSPQAILAALRAALGGVVGAISGMILVAVLFIFMLVEAAHLHIKLRRVFVNSPLLTQLENVGGDIQRYLAIKLMTSLITGVAIAALTGVLGLDFAVLWGMLAFILNFIPIFGSIIAAVPAVVLALLLDGPTFALSVVACFVVINVAIGSVLEPILMGHRLGISPLVVLLSVLFWGWVWGPAGMFLAVPLTMLLKIALEHHHDLRWIAVLLGSKASVAHVPH